MFDILFSSSFVSYGLKTFVTVLCASFVVSLSLAWHTAGHTGLGEACKQAHVNLIYTLWGEGRNRCCGAGHDRNR